jgi:hypothetical protein
MNQAAERGDLEEAFRLREEHLAELTGSAGAAQARATTDSSEQRFDALESRLQRLDARRKEAPGRGDNETSPQSVMPVNESNQRDEAQPEINDEIDWANVASEVAVMQELNKAADESWQGKPAQDS